MFRQKVIVLPFCDSGDQNEAGKGLATQDYIAISSSISTLICPKYYNTSLVAGSE